MRDLKEWIKSDEGLSLVLYQCPMGKYTIGYGRNLEDRGISQEEADYLLSNDISYCKHQLSNYDWYLIQPKEVKDALVNMRFNLGLFGLLQFKKMIDALKNKDYQRAAKEALDSRWAKQVGNRAHRIADVIRHAA